MKNNIKGEKVRINLEIHKWYLTQNTDSAKMKKLYHSRSCEVENCCGYENLKDYDVPK